MLRIILITLSVFVFNCTLNQTQKENYSTNKNGWNDSIVKIEVYCIPIIQIDTTGTTIINVVKNFPVALSSKDVMSENNLIQTNTSLDLIHLTKDSLLSNYKMVDTIKDRLNTHLVLKIIDSKNKINTLSFVNKYKTCLNDTIILTYNYSIVDIFKKSFPKNNSCGNLE